jgi:hypothetical protein
MHFPISLPFVADFIPDALPTTVEIQTASVLVEKEGWKLVRVRKHFLVKYGTGVDLTEGQYLLFAAETTNLPYPTVYALYTDITTAVNYMVMEYIDGNRSHCDRKWRPRAEEGI